VALDPEHRLLLSVVVGKRTETNARHLVHEVYERTEGRFLNRITADKYPAYATAIAEVYATTEGLPEWLVYATVHKTRKQNRVVKVAARLVCGTLQGLAAALLGAVLACVNTVFVERSNATDRHRNSRKGRKTYRFSKDGKMHEAMTSFPLYSGNFCWPVRTLREKVGRKRYRQ